MSDTLITVDNVSMKFCRSLKKSLWCSMQDLVNKVICRRNGVDGELCLMGVWAVKDARFELKCGDCLAPVARNVAGKTTLLTILNGLSNRDRGRVAMSGCVAKE